MKDAEQYVFTESQPFHLQPIFWVVTIGFAAIVFYLFAQDMIYGSVAYIIGAVLLMNLVFMFFARLRTRINDSGVQVKMIPFHGKWRSYAWEEIESAEVITYRPLRDYGGWGIRFSSKGTAYNVAGNVGLSLKLNNGKRYLIGTQMGEELGQIIKVYK